MLKRKQSKEVITVNMVSEAESEQYTARRETKAWIGALGGIYLHRMQ